MEATRKWRAKDLRRQWAHRQVHNAVESGKLVRPDHCEHCGTPCKPDAAHDDYDKPLEVEWLCRQCHVDKDRPAKS